MMSERLFRILGLVDDDLIEEANTVPRVKKPRRWLEALTAAACITLICSVGVSRLVNGGFGGSSDSASSSSASSGSTASGGTGINKSESASDSEPLGVGGTTFMSYAGPVLPLTLLEDAEDLTAERNTTWDFTPQTRHNGAPWQWGAAITDSYLLMNASTGEITAMASYPVACSLEELADHVPTITVNGQPQDWALHAGSYAGNFTHAGVENGSTWNLSAPDSWLDYQALLEDGNYFSEAFAAYPSLDTPVTLYSFTDFHAPEGYDAATQAVDFTIDPAATQILSYGFNGFWMEDNGWRRYDFFVPSALRHDETEKLLIVLGDDIRQYTLEGYENGACETVLPDVSCTVTRTETTLESVLETLCKISTAAYQEDFHRSDISGGSNLFDLISGDMYQGLITQLLVQHGVFAGSDAKDRYTDGRLDEIFREVLHQKRVLYLTFPITIPAGSSVEVTAELWKEPSFDYGCSGSEYVGLQGYDFVTQIGSNLEFTLQQAELRSTETVKISRQNFGFDLDAGISKVLLDPEQEHYYLEIQPVEE